MTDFLQMALEAYTSSTNYFDGSIRRPVEQAIRQFQGVHPAGSKYHAEGYRSRSRLFRPKTRAMVRKNEAVAAEAFFSTEDVVSISPEDQDNETQQMSSKVMQSLMSYRLRKSIPWFLTCIGAYQDSMVTGACVSYQYWIYDPKKGVDKPCIELLPLENIRIDPGANWADPINSSPYVIRLIPMYVKDVKTKMTETDIRTGQPRWKSLEDSQILSAMNQAGDSTRNTRERGRTDSKEQSQGITSFAIVWVHQNIIEVDGVDMVYFTLGTTALLTDPVPLKQVYFHGKRPFVMGYSMLEAHKTYPDGPVGVTKDVQAEINEIANQRIDNVKFALQKRYFAKRSAQVDIRSLVRNVVGSVTMMNDPEKDVVVHSTPDVTSSSYQEQDRLNLDFDDVSGSFSPSSINSNRKLNETVGGMGMIKADSNQVGNYQLRTFVETWAEPVLSQLVLLEQYYETDQVRLALAGKDAGLDMGKFGTDEAMDDLLMQDLVLRVNVGTGSANPQDQVNNFMLAMKNLREILADGMLERYRLDVAEVIKELFGKLGYKDGGRFFDTEEEDPRLSAAKATIQELQSELAQKISPELLQAQIRKLDAEIGSLAAKNKDISASMLEKNLRSIFASMQAAQMVASVPQIAPVADELMKAGGYQPPDPAGVDPNFPQPDGPAPGLVQNSVKDPRTGVEFMPGGDTTPSTPATPATPATGANAGIETMRNEQ